MADKPVDDLGKLNSDVLSEFDIDVEPANTFGRKVAAPVKGVANIIGHTAGGAISGVTNEIRNRFPQTAGLVGDAVGVVNDIKSLKDDVTSELTPAWNTLKGITLKMMPMTKLLMPKSLYSKIEKKLQESYEQEDERSEQQKLDEARTENINQQLTSIFSAQMEMQKLSEEKASAEKQTDRLLERTHFKADQAAFASIDQKLQAANNFLNGAFTAYMKKSLELKYRHLYVSTDIFNTVRVLTKITEARLEEIKHNTGLPEYAKVTMKERLVGSMKQKAVDSIVSWGDKLKDKYFENLKDKVMGDIKSFTQGIVPMLASSAGMFSDPSMVGGPIKKSDVIGKILGFFTGMGTSERTAKFLDSQDGHIGDLENAIAMLRKRIPFMAHEKIEALRMSDNPALRYLADAIPSRNIDTKIDTKTLVKDPNAVVPFDVSTRAAITQIIPAHLERIGDYVEGLSKYIAPDLKLENKTFNYVTQRLSSVKEFQSDLENEILSEDARATNLENSLAVTIGIAKNNKKTESLEKDSSITSLAKKKGVEGKFFSSEEFRELQQTFITNMMANQQIFEYGDIQRYLAGNGKTDWFKKAFKGLKEEEVQAVCKYYQSLCESHGVPDRTAIDKIQEMSVDVLGSEVIDVNMRQLYQRLGAGRHDRWTDAKTGEAVNTADWYNKRHLDDTGMMEQAEWISDRTDEERKRRKLRNEVNRRRDDRETARYRAQAREMGFGPAAEYLPPEIIKLIGDATTKVVQPFLEKATTAYETIKDKVSGALDNSYVGGITTRVAKSVKKIMKANSVEIADAYMKNANTLHIVYYVKDIEGVTKDRGDFDVRSSFGEWEAPTWDEVQAAWKEHERDELHSKLTQAIYEKAIAKFKDRGSKSDAKSYEKWRREVKTGVSSKEERNKRASDAIVERAIVEDTQGKVAETPSENNYIATMRIQMHHAMVVDIPSKIQAIITMMQDSDLFVKSPKHGSSEPAAKDSLLVRVNAGELILTIDQQKHLMEMLNGTRGPDDKIQHQDELMRALGMPIDDGFTTLFRKGGRAGKKKLSNKQKQQQKKQQQNRRKNKKMSNLDLARQDARPKNMGMSAGNKIADVVDSGIEKAKHVKDVVVNAATPIVDTAKDKLNAFAETAVGKKVTGIATSAFDKISSWWITLKDTITNREAFLSKFPAKWRDKIGTTFDKVISKSNNIGDYFTAVAKDLGMDKVSTKITGYLKDAANTIQDPSARRQFIISATQQMINIKDTITDSSKRGEALDKAKKELEDLADKLKNVKKDKKGFFHRKWVQAKMLWRKFKRSGFGKWASSLIDDETKAKIKEDFKSAKDSIKTGWTSMNDQIREAFGLKSDKKEESQESPSVKLEEQTQAIIDSSSNSKPKEDKPKDEPKKEEVKTDSGEKVAEGVSKETPKKEEPKPTTPSDKEEKSMFEGEPESRFHADFRSFANRLFTVLGNLKVGSAKGGKGVIGGALSGIGKGLGGIAKGAAGIYGGMLRGVGTAIGGIAKGAGTAISGIANSNIPSAIINGTGSLLGGLAKGYGSLAGGIFNGVGAGVGGIAKGIGSLFGGKSDDKSSTDATSETLGDKVRKVGTAIKNIINPQKSKYVDIYYKDYVQPDAIVLSAKQQEAGVQFEDGSRVESSADINRPVFGKKPGSDELQCLITADDIKAGLVDVNNEPIGKKKSGSIFDKMGLTGKLFKLGGKIAGGLMDFWGGLLGFGKKGLESAGKGAKSLLGKLFGIDGQDFSDYHRRVLDRLDRIIVLMGGEPPKDGGVKSDEVKKDEPKSSDIKQIEDVKAGLTPTEYSGVFKNKQGRYVDAKGKFVKDPTKQQQSTAEAKPEETKEPEQKKQEVTDESGDKVAEGVAKEDKKDEKEKEQSAKEEKKEQEKAEEAKQESLFKRIINFFGKSKDKEDKGKAAAEAAAKDKAEDAEKNKKAQEEFVERNKKREEERKKSEEDKKKRQAERDAVNDKAEKEGSDRLNKLQEKPGYEKARERVDKARGMFDSLKNKITDKLLGSENQFGRRTGGLLRGTKASALKLARSKIGRRWGGKYVAQIIKDPKSGTLNVLKKGGSALWKGTKFVGSKAGKFLAPVGRTALSLGSKAIAPITGAISAAGGIGPAMAAMATNPITLGILGAAAAGLSIYKGVKGASKANTKKNLGIKEGVQVNDRIASGLSQAMTFGLGGKGAAKFVRKGIDYVPGVGLVTLLMGDKDAMTDKEIRIFRTKCENKIKKGMKGYDVILAKFNKAVRMEDWPLARSISGNETSLVKNYIRSLPFGALAMDAAVGLKNLLIGNDDKPLTPQQINAFRKKLGKRVAKKDKLAEKLLSKFNDAVSEENWKLARELSGKKAEGLLNNSNAGRNAGALVGGMIGTLIPIPGMGLVGAGIGAVLGDFLNDPDKKPMSKKEIEDTVKFLSKQAAYNPKAKPILDKFQEAVENEDWKTARKLSGKEGKYLATKILKVAGKGLRIGAGILTLGLSELAMPGDQDKPLTEKEIQSFRSKMQFRIKKGDGMASRKLEAFDDAIAQQKWSKARRISKIKDEANIVKAGRFLKKITWDWVVGNDEEPMTEAEQQKFRDSMQRKIKMGDKMAQRKLDAFEDAVGNQKWKRARMISKMSNDGWGTKAAKAVGSFFSGLFGSDDAGMTDLEIKKFRDKMNDEIKSGNKAAQKKLDKFEDAVADQNWRRARAIAETPNKNIFSKMKDWTVKALWSGDQDSAMTDAEVEKFENEMNGRIQKGDTAARKLLDQFHEAVSNGLWAKARKIANVKKDGLYKEAAKAVGRGLLQVATFGLFGKGEATAEEVNELQEEIETKADEDESGLWQKVLDRFVSLKSQGMYQQAYDYGKKMLSSSLGGLQKNAKENKNVDEMEADFRIKKRQKDIVDNIMKSSKKLGWFGNADKKRELAILWNKAKFATTVDDDFLNGIEEELSEIDSEAEITKDSSSYKIDEPIRKMMKAQAKLRDIAVNTRDSKLTGFSAWLKSPFQWRSIRTLVDELTNTTPDELSDKRILDWNNRLSEIDGAGVKKITNEDIANKKKEKEAAKEQKETSSDTASKTIQVGNVTIRKNADGSRQTSVVSGKGTPKYLGALNGINDAEISTEVRRILKENNLDDSKYDKYVVKAITNLAIRHPAYKGLGIGLISGLAKMRARRHTKVDEKKPAQPVNRFGGALTEDMKAEIKSDAAKEQAKLRKQGFWYRVKDRVLSVPIGIGEGTLAVANASDTAGRRMWHGMKELGGLVVDGSKAIWNLSKDPLKRGLQTYGESQLMKARADAAIGKAMVGGLQKAGSATGKFLKRGLQTYGDAQISNAQAQADFAKNLYSVAIPSKVANKPKESLWDKTKSSVGSIGRSIWRGLKKGLTKYGESQMAQANAISSIFGKKKTEYSKNIQSVDDFDKSIGLTKADIDAADGDVEEALSKKVPNWDDLSSSYRRSKVQLYKQLLRTGKLTDTKVAAKPSVTGQLEAVAIPSKVANKPMTRSDQIDSKAQQSMEKHVKTSALFNREQQLSENNLAEGESAEGAATRDQTQILGEKLDRLTDAVYGVREATVEAGEGTSKRINNAQNQAIAQSAAYANSAISQTRPKPKEPGLKPASISTLRPALT